MRLSPDAILQAVAVALEGLAFGGGCVAMRMAWDLDKAGETWASARWVVGWILCAVLCRLSGRMAHLVDDERERRGWRKGGE